MFGLDAWRAFAHHIALHRLAPLANHVGLRALLSQSWAGRWVAVMQPGSVDPFQAWAALRRATFAARTPLYLALAAALAALVVAGTWRVHRLWVAIAASTLAIVVAVDVASYYCAVFVLLALLAARSRALEWLALAAVVASRAVNALPIAVENPDLRYSAQSVVFVAWGATALGLLARARIRSPAPTEGGLRKTTPPGSGGSRLRLRRGDSLLEGGEHCSPRRLAWPVRSVGLPFRRSRSPSRLPASPAPSPVLHRWSDRSRRTSIRRPSSTAR
jgi:hypothetical protein